MSKLSQAVSIHPYFKLQEGKLDEFKEIIKLFIERTQTEDKCFYYDYSYNAEANTVHCREAYEGAAGVLTQLDNVGDVIEKALTLSELAILEIHGPATELAQLKEPLADLPVKFYEHIDGAKF